MTTNNITNLSDEKFQEIYTNEKFRNAVAFAHGCYDSNSNFKHYKALDYPQSWIVTPDQISLAEAERQRSKAEKVADLQKGALVFVGMGMDYKARFEGDICNHRIRTNFKNNEGHAYFVEFCRNGRKENTLNDFVCDFSIDEDWRKEQEAEAIRLLDIRNSYVRYSKEWEEVQKEYKANDHQRYYNAFGIQHSRLEMQFSDINVLQLINETFGCSYTSLIVDNYTLTTDDFTCFC